MPAYYNENDGYAAQWLRNLIGAGLIAPGDVDERSIVDVRANDLAGYEQCHFFAGIGGWSYALRLAGWPDDRPVWTGSCPCQPFSAAGAGKAADDERHLWPEWFPLIAKLRPSRIYGEQVEAAIGWGWLDVVLSDLEGEGYACGTTVLPACSVGAPHVRQRAWFVADTDGGNASAEGVQRGREHGQWTQDGLAGELLADTLPTGRSKRRPFTGHRSATRRGGIGIMGDAARDWQRQPRITQAGERRSREAGGSGAWSNLDWLACTDGKARPVEPGTFPLAHGIPGRVGRLRAYGNAIVPQVAAEFIRASCEAIDMKAGAA